MDHKELELHLKNIGYNSLISSSADFAAASEEAKKKATYFRSLSDKFRFISIAVNKKPIDDLLG